ncbi:hypothetical protein [Janthinobacterium sp. Ant5-2-1]|uniref:hypothetical protein n=1 Tax=Janthinobacterium sp. Ant5-2-1 TaxID=1755239 RepID=UPI00071827DA|nr:hypothetical protein [Janthinobacterium sp. Ant5-2-1]
MPLHYSPSTGNFYPDEISYANLPDDLIEVDDKDFTAAMSRPRGHTFAFKKGKLVISAPVPELFATQFNAYLVGVRKTRDGILNRLAGIGFAAMADGDADTVQTIAAARAWLLDITICPTVAAAQDIEVLRAAVSAEYVRIAATLSDEGRRAFADAGITLPASVTP